MWTLRPLPSEHASVHKSQEQVYCVWRMKITSISTNRNPRLWSGKMLNISQKSDGQLSVNFKPMRLEGQTNVDQLIASIYLDLLKAKKDLGL